MLTRRFRTALVGFFYAAFEGNGSLSLCKVYSVLHHSAYHIGIAVSRFTDTTPLQGCFSARTIAASIALCVHSRYGRRLGDATGDRTQNLHLEGVACYTNSTMAPYKGSFPEGRFTNRVRT